MLDIPGAIQLRTFATLFVGAYRMYNGTPDDAKQIWKHYALPGTVAHNETWGIADLDKG